MNGNEVDVILKLTDIIDWLLSGKSKFNLGIVDVDGIEDENVKSLAGKILHLCEQYRECYGFMMDLSRGKLYTESPRQNVFANPFKQLHSELRYLTWQIQQIADGDYDQSVSFSGDFSDAINKMIVALRERQVLSERIREIKNLFHSIFITSPDGIVLCDLNHCIINASNAVYRMLQVSDEINGNKNFGDIIHPEDLGKYKRFLETLLNGVNTTAFAELRVVSADGKYFWSEQNASILLDSNSNPKGYIIIIRDISERKDAEAQLLQYTDELDESNRTKDKLFSIIAHDLKSPFNTLLGLSSLLERETNQKNVNIEKIKHFSKIIHTSASKSFDLLVNLLEWSRLQSERIMINPEELNLNELIMYNVDMGQTVAMNKNISLEYITSISDECTIVSDKAMVNTVLRNLINNAIKYTPQNGNITVSLVKDDGMFRISVKDNGVGITEEIRKDLFRTNAIQSTPGTDNEKGTGLGLVLCRDFVNKLGGDIWVESVYGHGATFTFSLKNL